MLVLPRDGDATLVVPRLEAPRVVERPDVFTIRPWDETDDPIAMVAELVGPAATRGHRRPHLGPVRARPAGRATRRPPSAGPPTSPGPLRAVKEPGEVEALRQAAAAVDRIAAQLQAGDIPLVGRTEAEVSADLGRRMVDEGHQRVNFAIVAAGENAASPPPRGRRAGDPPRRGRAVRLRRHDARRRGRRLLQRHHPVRADRRTARRGGRGLRRAARGPAAGVRGRPWAHPASGSTPSPARSSPRPATASGSSTARATASASRSTRTPTSSRATAPRWRPATPSRSSRASTCPGRFGIRLEDIVVADAAGLRRPQHRRPRPGGRRRLRSAVIPGRRA